MGDFKIHIFADVKSLLAMSFQPLQESIANKREVTFKEESNFPHESCINYNSNISKCLVSENVYYMVYDYETTSKELKI